jgi:predicted AAA+ superfamily ATPase
MKEAPVRPRLYTEMLREHFLEHRQMALLSGPRQVGKTTTCRGIGTHYLNWDSLDDRRQILRGPGTVATLLGLEQLSDRPKFLVLDELHKNPKWRGFLKGFFDVHGDQVRILVTGSSRIDVARRGGDSLMGRYLPYRMHPWSVAECFSTALPDEPIRPPRAIPDADWSALLTHGGFPEPFLKRDLRFTRRWQSLRREQLTRGDLRELTQLQNLGAMETLTMLLAEQSAGQLVYARLSRDIGVAVDTVRHWVDLLSRLHYGFAVRPWFKNVRRALRKEPKWFLRDWSAVVDPGAQAETFVACHLLKAVEGWSDLGLGAFELRYLRDKQQREVDFLVVRDSRPWFLVEVKRTDTRLSDQLAYFQNSTGAKHAFQVVLDLPFVRSDPFTRSDPVVVPARTLLSQLL